MIDDKTKMPDKIYVHRTIHLGFLSGTEIPIGYPDESEYIRKDTLLEWAKEYQKRHFELSNQHPEDRGVYVGNACAMSELISKINSYR